MTLATRLRERTGAILPPAPSRTRLDVLFVVVVGVLLAVHLVIFGATLALAPVTADEQRGLVLVQLPVEVARVLVLPFHALLLGCLFLLGRRAAGRWAGFGSMLALLSLDLTADPARPVYGPPTAEGAWVAAALLAASLVVLARRPLLAAALLGVAAGFSAVLVLALPAFLAAIALTATGDRRTTARLLGGFAGVWAVAALAVQILWLGRLGAAGWAARAADYAAPFRPHPLVPFLEQQRLLFASWHFPALLTVVLAMILFVAAGVGIARWFRTPRPGESGRRAVLRRLPVEWWAAGSVLLVTGVWWALSGLTVIVEPNLPVLAAIAPVITALAYRAAKWLLTVNRFWALTAVLYLVGLILARSTQLVLTLIGAFHP